MKTGRGVSCTASSGGSSNSSASRANSRKLWRMRSKSQSRSSLTSVCLWNPQEGQQWTDIQNRLVILSSCQLQQLCPVEAALLRQLAAEKLAEMNLGYSVRVPKDEESPPPVSKPKRRQKVISRKPAGIFDLSKREEPAIGKNRTSGMVFGISLTKCLENDRLLGRSVTSDLCVSDEVTCRQVRAASHSSCSSWTTTEKGCGSYDSLDRAEKRPSLEESSLTFTDLDRCDSLAVQPVQVPRFVDTCIKHIDRHGLNTIGIFRVSSSKKRSRQLRDEFDTGKEIELDEDCCPHVVATLLKEFLRDMERPLLPHELYAPFLATQRVRNRRQQLEMMQWLLRLLPVPNRDTLSVLLSFLKRVADSSSDRRSPAGDWISGNRMDSSNLATLFAPNVLHSLAQATAGIVAAVNSGSGGGGGCGEQAAAHTAERIDAINVFRSLIDYHVRLFQVSAEDLHSVYLVLMERNPEYLDVLLRRRYSGLAAPEQGCPNRSFHPTDFKNVALRSNSIPITENEHRNIPARQMLSLNGTIDHEHSQPSVHGIDFTPCPQECTNMMIEKTRRAGVIGHIGRTAEKFSPTQGAKWLRRRVRSCHGAKRRTLAEGSSGSSSAWFQKRDKSTGSCCSDSSGESSERRHRRCSVPHAQAASTQSEGVGRSTRRQRNTRSAKKESIHRHCSSSSDPETVSTATTTVLNATLRVTMSNPNSNCQQTQTLPTSYVEHGGSEFTCEREGGKSRVTETRVAADDVEDTFMCSLRIQPVAYADSSKHVVCESRWQTPVASKYQTSMMRKQAKQQDNQEHWNQNPVCSLLSNNCHLIAGTEFGPSAGQSSPNQAGKTENMEDSSSTHQQSSTVQQHNEYEKHTSISHRKYSRSETVNKQSVIRQLDKPASTSIRKRPGRKSVRSEAGSGTPSSPANNTTHIWKRHEIISSVCDTSS